MALGLLGANVVNLAHGKVWCVDPKRQLVLIRNATLLRQ
jgi:hypothetical protein